jgi:UDP-N-acetylmuramate--alanine ligase
VKNDIPTQNILKGKHYHLTGIAGTGMNALAQVLYALGASVSGSDRYYDTGTPTPELQKLSAAGIKLFPQNGSGITEHTAALIRSTAIEDDNPELKKAGKNNIPVIHRAEMLAGLAKNKKVIAVAGTSGKSTVTGMTGYILTQAGFDPTVVNGAALLNWKTNSNIGNVRIGSSDWWVLEVDESDRSLFCFNPFLAVITNVSADHFPLNTAEDIFGKFSDNVKQGIIGYCDDGTYQKALKSCNFECNARGCSFKHNAMKYFIQLQGRHNAVNALQAVLLCEAMGISKEQISSALAQFRGIERRLQTIGTAGKARVIDDYAHNPAQIRVAFDVLRNSGSRIFAVWRPHGFAPLAKTFNQLVTAFAESARTRDTVYILPVYYAGGTTNKNVNSVDLVGKLTASGVNAKYMESYDALFRDIMLRIHKSDIIIFMGARDPELPVQAERIAEMLK